MHKVQPYQAVKIITVQIAVPADEDEGYVADEISAMLTENGIANPESSVLDWQYVHQAGQVFVKAGAEPEEGEVFVLQHISGTPYYPV